MKKIILSIAAILIAGASLMAIAPAHAKKVSQATCNSCGKDNCTEKAGCPNTDNCVCK